MPTPTARICLTGVSRAVLQGEAGLLHPLEQNLNGFVDFLHLKLSGLRECIDRSVDLVDLLFGNYRQFAYTASDLG